MDTVALTGKLKQKFKLSEWKAYASEAATNSKMDLLPNGWPRGRMPSREYLTKWLELACFMRNYNPAQYFVGFNISHSDGTWSSQDGGKAGRFPGVSFGPLSAG